MPKYRPRKRGIPRLPPNLKMDKLSQNFFSINNTKYLYTEDNNEWRYNFLRSCIYIVR
jgi:hypothetical protein